MTMAIAASPRPSAAPAIASATVRGRVSAGAARVTVTCRATAPDPAPFAWRPPAGLAGRTAVTACTGFTIPLPVPAPAVPSAVAAILATTCAALSPGKAARTSAATPETKAAAKLVPLSASE
jgi:hypothetical protein